MPRIISPVTFAGGSLASYFVPVTSNYLIVAAGAEGGAGAAFGGKGALTQGIFYLRAGDVLQMIIGQQGQAAEAPELGTVRPPCGGGGGGGTFLWKTTSTGILPAWPLLIAGGGGGGGIEPGGDGGVETSSTPAVGSRQSGHGGAVDPCCHFGGGGGTGWLSAGGCGPGPIFCNGGRQWAGGTGIAYGLLRGGDGGFGGGGGGGFLGYAAGGGGGFNGGAGGGQIESQFRIRRSTGGTSYNSGLDPIHLPGHRSGHGTVTIAAAPEPLVVPARPGVSASHQGSVRVHH